MNKVKRIGFTIIMSLCSMSALGDHVTLINTSASNEPVTIVLQTFQIDNGGDTSFGESRELSLAKVLQIDVPIGLSIFAGINILSVNGREIPPMKCAQMAGKMLTVDYDKLAGMVRCASLLKR